jgi:hypothetical protein
MFYLLLLSTFLVLMHSLSQSDRPLEVVRGRKRKAEADDGMKLAKRLAAETVRSISSRIYQTHIWQIQVGGRKRKAKADDDMKLAKRLAAETVRSISSRIYQTHIWHIQVGGRHRYRPRR